MSFDYDFVMHSAGAQESAPQRPPTRSPAAPSKPPCSFAAFTIGVERGPLLCAYSQGRQSGIASQIAVKLAKDTIVREALASEGTNGANGLDASNLVQTAFRKANLAVYEYGHRMFSKGQLAAIGWIAAYDRDVFTVGRVGPAECLLCRDGRMQKFFLEASAPDLPGVMERFLGANSQVLVDLGSVTVKHDDILVVHSGENGVDLSGALSSLKLDTLSANEIAQAIEKGVSGPALNSLLVLKVGTPPIVLREVVFEEFDDTKKVGQD